MKALRDELPRSAIGQHRHRRQLIIGLRHCSDGGRAGGELSRTRMGGPGSWLSINCRCSRRCYESEVLSFQLVMGEDIGRDCLGFCPKGGVILRIFVGALIKK